MKHIILFLLFFVMPVNLWASDHCTDPDKYTVDKRCYVTDEQKKEKPYNAVVAFGGGGAYGVHCTGTIVKQDGDLYVYTAKHCVYKKYPVRLIDGTVINDVDVVAKGNFVYDHFTGDMQNENGDWAILKINVQDVPYVNLSTYPTDETAISLGYGGLKILSDKEITGFKENYIAYLEKYKDPSYESHFSDFVSFGSGNEDYYGINEDGSLRSLNGFVRDFIADPDSDYLHKFFTDSENLKVSYCKYDSSGNAIGCQCWSGDSGGGLFDYEGNLMAIRSSSTSVIGGKNHAGNQDAGGYIKLSDKTE